MATNPKKHPNRARPKPLTQGLGIFEVNRARAELAHAQNIEKNHPSKKHKELRVYAEKYVLETINAYKKRKKAKKL